MSFHTTQKDSPPQHWTLLTGHGAFNWHHVTKNGFFSGAQKGNFPFIAITMNFQASKKQNASGCLKSNDKVVQTL